MSLPGKGLEPEGTEAAVVGKEVLDAVVLGLYSDHVVRERNRPVGVLLEPGDGPVDERRSHIQHADRLGVGDSLQCLLNSPHYT